MSFFGEGNYYLNQSYVTNTTINNSLLQNNSISACTIDMLSTSGNYQNIINVKSPINPNDAVIKSYVDNLGIVVSNYTLSGTTGTVISTNLIGSYLVTVNTLVSNGPCANFSVSKSNQNNCGQIMRTTLGPGTNKVALDITWPANSGIQLSKTQNNCDGSYIVKLL
jgi:hypothetical protein